MTTQEATLSQRASDGVRTAFGVGGLVAIVLGLLILFFPTQSGSAATQLLAAILAAYVLVMGVVYIGTAIFSKVAGGWARIGHIVLGLLYVVGGVVMLANLGATAVVLAVFLSITIGILWLFEGIFAFATLRNSTTKVWTVVYASISVIAGLALLFSPLLGAVTLWFLLGLSMVVMGVVQVVRAFSVKSEG